MKIDQSRPDGKWEWQVHGTTSLPADFNYSETETGTIHPFCDTLLYLRKVIGVVVACQAINIFRQRQFRLTGEYPGRIGRFLFVSRGTQNPYLDAGAIKEE